MTLCNMAIEAGARVGLVAVDDTTISYLRDRPLHQAGRSGSGGGYWRTLVSDSDAVFDKTGDVDATDCAHGDVGHVARHGAAHRCQRPDPASEADPATCRHAARTRLHGPQSGTSITAIRLDKSSSARAPTRASRTSAQPPRSWPDGMLLLDQTGARRAGLGPREGAGRGRRAGPRVHRRRFDGASPAARCAWA